MTVATASRLTAGVFLLCLFSSAAWAAPGDPLGTLQRIGQGGVNDHDPYFETISPPRSTITLNNGNVVVAWNARDTTSAPLATPDSPDGADGLGDAGFIRVYDAGGSPVTGVIRPYLDINPTGVGEQDPPLLAQLAGGGFVATWNSAGGPGDTPAGNLQQGDTWGRVYDANGTPVSGTFHVNENDPRPGIEDTQLPVAVAGLTGRPPP